MVRRVVRSCSGRPPPGPGSRPPPWYRPRWRPAPPPPTPRPSGCPRRARTSAGPQFDPVRPPAIPLVVKSPYLSTWLAADNTTGTWPTFWTGRITAMLGIIRIDGESFLFIGSEPTLSSDRPYPLPTMREVSVEVTATQSRFVLQQAGVELDLTFFSPVEPGDLQRQSRPLSYITAAVQEPGRRHPLRQRLPRHLR